MRRVCFIIALAGLLTSAACGGNKRSDAHTSALTPTDTALPKAASALPSSERLVARNASIALNAGGYTLAWKYENPGDYSQDGVVGLEDIAPLAEHFNEASSPANEWIDGSGNGKVGIEDITPIAVGFGSEVTGYRIDGAEATEGPWNEVASLTLDEGDASEGRLVFTQEIAPGWTYYRVVTLTPDGDAAFSEPLLAPSAEPIIYGVSPINGYQHEEYTFTATASGQEPLTYEWDFGGGASPDTSSDISPTVTLSDAGEYSATLTISNSYGPATFPFTLTVSARDTWAHTWGGAGTESLSSLAVDGAGTVYTAGFTDSFGAGESDILFLKFDTTGAAEGARTWGGEGYESACSIKLTASNEVCVAGRTTTYGAGYDDILLLKYDTSGDLLWSKTWGTAAYERPVSMAVDADGNMYVCGSYLEWGGKDDILLCKFDSEGNLQWTETWGGADYDNAKDVAVSADGVYVCGTTESFGAGDKDVLLIMLNHEGEIQWARTLGSADSDGALSLCVDDSRVYFTGYSRSFGQGGGDVLVCAFDINGNVTWQRTWGNEKWQVGEGIALNDNNDLIVAGSTDSFSGGYRDALVLGLDTEGNLLWSKTWGGEGENRANELTLSSTGDMYIVGIAPNCSGTWVNIEGVVSEAELTIGFPEAILTFTAGSQSTPEGTQTDAVGIFDAGGGDDDALVLKNYPR